MAKAYGEPGWDWRIHSTVVNKPKLSKLKYTRPGDPDHPQPIYRTREIPPFHVTADGLAVLGLKARLPDVPPDFQNGPDESSQPQAADVSPPDAAKPPQPPSDPVG